MLIKDSEKAKNYQREYYAKNSDKIKIYMKEYRRKNSEKIKANKKEYYRKNSEKLKANKKEYCRKYPEKVSVYNKKYRRKYPEKVVEHNLKSRYGLTSVQWWEIYYAQCEKCPICGEFFKDEDNVVVDHDHKTKKVRGLLHQKCNRALGLLHDDLKLLRRAVRYLMKREGYY